ncbi:MULTISPECIES: hypothetical protein [unclassified Streptomyces]|uniref:hypothetical protein n=1 Tax=unclassified Streptomyces TaxID=2593676 RepID=UPI002DDBFE40|nr:hypothetical protein [Streptomyces sp. NBC_01750]WSB04918.1 hypothetical protein OIE54_40275 [Streptomyces sp. NBC_01794]WSD30805.1 hypothetical protein OG966_01850 [Streptomyces sp. NBC_01750]
MSVIYRVDTPQLPTRRTHRGFVDGIGEPDIEGSGVDMANLFPGPDHYGYLPGFGAHQGRRDPDGLRQPVGPAALMGFNSIVERAVRGY